VKKLPFNLCIAFLAGFLMNFVTPAFSSPTPNVTATTTVPAAPTPPTTLEPSPVLEVLLYGAVVDAVLTVPIPGATVSTDTGGYITTTDADGTYVMSNIAGGDYIVTASATGYESSSLPVTLVEGEVTQANFELVPTPPPTTPTVTPPLPLCEPEAVLVSPSSLKLKRKKSGDVTVRVTGEEDCAFEDVPVTATINKAGKKCILVSPTFNSTDSNGEAKFTITAKRVGNARVIIKAGSVKKTMIVKVRR